MRYASFQACRIRGKASESVMLSTVAPGVNGWQLGTVIPLSNGLSETAGTAVIDYQAR
jgi:hypothetical protein